MSGTNYGNSLQIWNYGTNGSNASRLVITDDGNVGIGVGKPVNKLEVVGNVKATSLAANSLALSGDCNVTGNSVVNGSGEIGNSVTITNTSKTQAGQANQWKIYNMSGTNYGNSLQIWNYGSNGSNAGRLVITDDGNVGIGVGKPVNKLEVNGTIRAKEIKVETGWADFIFANEYQLSSLREVKQYISENKHLPGIPSEAEVKENGVNLGEMQVKLLQKIEELTLYSIQQQEMIEKLNAKIEKLENEKK